MSNQQLTREQTKKLIDFPFADIPDKVSYHTTMPTKRLIQGGLVQTTTIASGTKSTNWRKQTKEEQLYDLRRVLEL